MKIHPTVAALFGALAICFGSMIVIAAPGDGQTGMVAFPAYGAGAIGGIYALSRLKEVTPQERRVIFLLAAVAVGSVGWGFYACQRYSADLVVRKAGAVKPTSPPR